MQIDNNWIQVSSILENQSLQATWYIELYN